MSWFWEYQNNPESTAIVTANMSACGSESALSRSVRQVSAAGALMIFGANERATAKGTGNGVKSGLGIDAWEIGQDL